MPDDCIFCKVVAGELPAEVVARDDGVVAIRDQNPQAPTHVLVIPHEHIASIHELGPEHRDLWFRLLQLANRVADEESISEAGYRLVANVGRNGGQTVNHLHLHLMGGRQMTWPPG